MIRYNTIIIGAGPCGIMCSHTIKNKKTLILDANSFLGGKIKVSGGGRCNVTNNKDINSFLLNVPKNNKFLYSTFSNFEPKEVINFFTNNGIELKEEDNNRIFPASNNSQEIVDFFYNAIKKDALKELKLNYTVKSIIKEENYYIIDNRFSCENLVLAMGGVSYPHISQGFESYELVKALDHSITNIFPCESPLVISDPIIESKILQGVTLKNCLGELYINKKKKLTLKKDILFTHFGLSGPLALNFSFYTKEALNNGKEVNIKLFPTNPPKKIIPFLDEDTNSISFNISDIKGFKTAFVTNGGVNLKEINPTTLESKFNSNLFIGGELLDINCFTGGYNIGTYLCMGKLIGDKINER